MAFTVTLVSGPRRSGKSAVVQRMIGSSFPSPPHYLRLTSVRSGKRKPACPDVRPSDCGIASAGWVLYEPGRVFEVLDERLRKLEAKDCLGAVVIEADADPCLRQAYPYGTRVFVMPACATIRDVFRTSSQTADVLREALDDTSTFAAEIFGVTCDGTLVDDDAHEERPRMTAAQLRGFLCSPLGDELTARFQLQPAFQGLVDSDVILMNTGTTGERSVQEETLRRIEGLVERLRPRGHVRAGVYCCDPLDGRDPLSRRFFDSLRSLCVSEAG